MFEKFIGKVVQAEEIVREYDGRKHSYFQSAKGDPVISEIKALNNNNVRVWFPNSAGTMDYRVDRVNVYVEKNAEDYFVITKINRG